ncbi:hypothetical protein NKJ87_28545 [Mesorhizobium sp. M0027]|uniref:hypothetical protein n=1 Tax=Mesorhizobium sp. M0027 TaxID=2956848 RepID=UPI003336BA7D
MLKLLQRWRDEAGQAGHTVKPIAVAHEAAGDGFWLALAASARHRGLCHPYLERSSVARAKTNRLDPSF